MIIPFVLGEQINIFADRINHHPLIFIILVFSCL